MGLLGMVLKKCACDDTTQGETTVTGVAAMVGRDWEVNL